MSSNKKIIHDLLPPGFFVHNHIDEPTNNVLVEQSQNIIPKYVRTNNKNGVEDTALILAKMFMSKMGRIARQCRTRGHLSELYITTIPSWATSDIQDNINKQRPFKQVLYAIAYGLKRVRVHTKGRRLYWNQSYSN